MENRRKQSAHLFLEPSISLVRQNAVLCGNGLKHILQFSLLAAKVGQAQNPQNMQ